MTRDRKNNIICQICSFENGRNGDFRNFVNSLSDVDNKTRVYICDKCIEDMHSYLNKQNKVFEGDILSPLEYSNLFNDKGVNRKKKKLVTESKIKINTPKDIYGELKKYVIGQDSYLKALALFGYNHMKRMNMVIDGVKDIPRKDNLWAVGPTGTGKTLGICTLAKIIDVPFIMSDMTQYTEAGYIGADVEEIIRKLIINSNNDLDRSQFAIIALDEIDKTAFKQNHSSDPSRSGLQQALLKLVEGNLFEDLSVPLDMATRHKRSSLIEFNTSNISFVAMGAFSGLKSILQERNSSQIGFRSNSNSVEDKEEIAYKFEKDEIVLDDLYKYGMLPELVARFSMFEVLSPLTKGDLKRIIVEPCDSILKTETKRFQNEGIELTVEESFIDYIASEAYKSKIGGRGLKRAINKCLKDLEFEYFGDISIVEVILFVDKNGKVKDRIKRAKVIG